MLSIFFSRCVWVLIGYVALVYCGLIATLNASANDGCNASSIGEITVDAGHRWKPPFGLDRIGALPVVHVRLKAPPSPDTQYFLTAHGNGQQTEKHRLTFTSNGISPLKSQDSSSFANVSLATFPNEVTLLLSCNKNQPPTEITRQAVHWPTLEIDAQAKPDSLINPIDLGAVLVPHHWLLLEKYQSAVVTVAALAHDRDIPNARLRVGFEGSSVIDSGVRLVRGKKIEQRIKVPLKAKGDRTGLHLSLWDGSRELWKKDIPTMVARETPHWPTFGAVETKLRYDDSILRHDRQTTQKLTPLDYASAWDPELHDVVVFLPNGSRFVFWRGSNYAPFWASGYNTGVSYQWAEDLSHPIPHPRHANAIQDFPEPMFDAELRYSRVRIISSTVSRVHVRWTYQPTTLYDQRFGEQVTEDFYFYPDGFGIRVASLLSPREEGTRFQFSEFLILGPRSAYPFEVLPEHLVEMLSLKGRSVKPAFPLSAEDSAALADQTRLPAVYKIFAHKDDPEPAIYFAPHQIGTLQAWPPMRDQGEVVTPVYWGGYWPLARGEPTSWGINDRLYSTPSFSSIAAFHSKVPGAEVLDTLPCCVSEQTAADALGQSRELLMQRWYWLIAKTGASDAALRGWARSFSSTPSAQLKGARLDAPAYSPERRALRLIVEQPLVEAIIRPDADLRNPVFELSATAGMKLSRNIRVAIDGRPVPEKAYAWDGHALWVQAVVPADGAKVRIEFR